MLTDESTCGPEISLGALDFWGALDDTLELAIEVDRLGYARYWLTEHPPEPSPLMLLGILAGLTGQMRVGTAGLQTHFYNPLATAQNFLLLERLYPGRIEAGFCGGGTDELVAEALLEGRADARQDPRLYAEKLETLIGFLRNDLPAGHRYAGLRAWPKSAGTPEIWNFGTGQRSAELAARQGIAFGYSIFHHWSKDDPSLIARYLDAFQPSVTRSAPLAALAVAGVCAETQREAQRLKEANPYKFVVPTVAGTPEQCFQQLLALSERYGTRELVFMDVCVEYEDRVRSYSLLAEICGLRQQALTAA